MGEGGEGEVESADVGVYCCLRCHCYGNHFSSRENKFSMVEMGREGRGREGLTVEVPRGVEVLGVV